MSKAKKKAKWKKTWFDDGVVDHESWAVAFGPYRWAQFMVREEAVDYLRRNQLRGRCGRLRLVRVVRTA